MKRKFKNITVPYKYYDKKENYTYYIYKDKKYYDLNKLFKVFLGSYLIYHYEIKDKIKEVYNLSDVLYDLIQNYDTFNIPSKYKKEYSTMEYEFINNLQKTLKDNKLNPPYVNKFSYEGRIVDSKNYQFTKNVYYKYKDVKIPKRIKSDIYHHNYYVVGGTYYESLYYALDDVYGDYLEYQFGGTKKINNRTHLKAHNFDDLISLIFSNTNKFIIHVFQQEYYSKQELDFLNLLADKLNNMGYKSVQRKYNSLNTTEYNYLKDNHKYFKLLIHNIRYKKEERKYQKEILKSHKL